MVKVFLLSFKFQLFFCRGKPRKTHHLTMKKNCAWVPLEGHRLVEINYVLGWALKVGTYHAKQCSKVDIYPEEEANSRYAMSKRVVVKCGGCGVRFSGSYTNPNNTNRLARTLVLGTLLTGQTYSSTKGLLAPLGVSMMAESTFYKFEPMLDEPLQQMFEESCDVAREEEKDLAEAEGRLNEDGIPLVAVSQDGAYSKRSYGTRYSADSGCAAIVGERTGKVLWGGVKNKNCVLCQKVDENGEIREHTCYHNYDGPSSSMEVELVKEGHLDVHKQSNMIMSPVTGDGDTKGFLKLKEELPWGSQLEKEDCSNHAVRAVNNRLLAVRLNELELD